MEVICVVLAGFGLRRMSGIFTSPPHDELVAAAAVRPGGVRELGLIGDVAEELAAAPDQGGGEGEHWYPVLSGVFGRSEHGLRRKVICKST